MSPDWGANILLKFLKAVFRSPVRCPSGAVPQRGPPAYEALLPFIKALWQASEQPCGKRLRPILRDWLPYWKKPTGRSPPPTACFSKSQRGPA